MKTSLVPLVFVGLMLAVAVLSVAAPSHGALLMSGSGQLRQVGSEEVTVRFGVVDTANRTVQFSIPLITHDDIGRMWTFDETTLSDYGGDGPLMVDILEHPAPPYRWWGIHTFYTNADPDDFYGGGFFANGSIVNFDRIEYEVLAYSGRRLGAQLRLYGDSIVNSEPMPEPSAICSVMLLLCCLVTRRPGSIGRR